MGATQDREATATRRAANLMLTLLFVAGIAMPCVGTLFGLDTGGVVGENRFMAQFPTAGVGIQKNLRRQMDAWFDDHFGLRNSLLQSHSWIEYEVFGVSSSRDVVLGRDGWLFYATDRIIESRRGLLPFMTEELRGWQSRLEERRDWLAGQGIRYIFVIAPEKSSLYAELLPETLHPVREHTRADQLFAWMREHSTVATLDFRETLRTAKDADRIYHRTDTHWNDVGAFAAYRRLAEWLQTEFPAVRPLDAAQLDRQVRVTPGGDLAGMLALMPHLSEERITLVPKNRMVRHPQKLTAVMRRRNYTLNLEPQVYECPTGEIGRAVVVHDSFFQAVKPFLVRHFRRSTFVSGVFPPDVIAAEKPDVVIEEMVERVLSRPGFLPLSVHAAVPP